MIKKYCLLDKCVATQQWNGRVGADVPADPVGARARRRAVWDCCWVGISLHTNYFIYVELRLLVAHCLRTVHCLISDEEGRGEKVIKNYF